MAAPPDSFDTAALREALVGGLPEGLPSSLAQLLRFRPRQNGGARWLGYLPFLAWLVQEQRPKQSVALGLGSGAAYFALCQAAAALPPGNDTPPRFYGIDQPGLGAAAGTRAGAAQPAAQPAAQSGTQSAAQAAVQSGAQSTVQSGAQGALPTAASQGALPTAGPPELAEPLRRANAAYAPLSRLICADPLRAHRAFDPGATDLLLVDLPLSAAVLTHLAQEWLPLMSPRGMILLCGTEPGRKTPLEDETAAALRQLLAQRPHLKLPWAGGMVALLCGDLPVPALAQLAALAPEAPARQALLDLLARAGEPVLQEAAIAEAEQKILTLQAELARRQESAAQELAALTRLAEARQGEADARQSEAEARQSEANAALAAAQKQLGALKTELDAAQSQHHRSTSQHEALAAELSDLRGKRLNDSHELAVFARLCEDHRRTADQAQARESKLRQELAQMGLHLEGTRAEVAALRASTSWRLTAPLRRVITLLRAKRGG